VIRRVKRCLRSGPETAETAARVCVCERARTPVPWNAAKAAPEALQKLQRVRVCVNALEHPFQGRLNEGVKPRLKAGETAVGGLGVAWRVISHHRARPGPDRHGARHRP